MKAFIFLGSALIMFALYAAVFGISYGVQHLPTWLMWVAALVGLPLTDRISRRIASVNCQMLNNHLSPDRNRRMINKWLIVLLIIATGIIPVLMVLEWYIDNKTVEILFIGLVTFITGESIMYFLQISRNY